MSRHRFFQGMHYELRGREYVIQERLQLGLLQTKDIVTQNLVQISDGDLLQSWVRGELRFLGGEHYSLADRNRMKSFIEDLTAIADDDPRKSIMRRRYAYVEKLLECKSPSIADVKETVTHVHEELKESGSPPSWKTVYYCWFKRFVDSGADIRALLPDFKKRGNTNAKFCGRSTKGLKYSTEQLEIAEELNAILDRVIREKYLTTQRLTVDAVYDALLVRIAEENITRVGREFPLPSRRAIYKRVSKLDRYEVVKCRFSKRDAEKRFRAFGICPETTRLLQRVELDSTPLHLMVLDEQTGMPIGRPTFTTAIDAYTKMILGFHISFDGEGALALLQCLLHSIQPKNYVKERYEHEVLGSWDAFGLPELVVVDNGPGQHSRAFEDASLQLGFSVQYCPVKKPWTKGAVERYLGSQNSSLLHGLPGTTFSDIFDRGEYDPREQAIICFKTLLTILHKYVIDYYQNRIHRGINDVPARRWSESAAVYPPSLPPHRDELKVLLGHTEQRTLQHYGIELFNLRYNGPAVERLRRLHDKRTKFKIKYDPSDLGVIWVLDPNADKFLAVPSVRPNYTSGLRLYNHRVVQNYLRKRNRDVTNSIELARAREEIHRIVQRDWQALKSIGPRKRMARYLDIAQPNYSQAEHNSSPTAGEDTFPPLGLRSNHVHGTSSLNVTLNETRALRKQEEEASSEPHPNSTEWKIAGGEGFDGAEDDLDNADFTLTKMPRREV